MQLGLKNFLKNNNIDYIENEYGVFTANATQTAKEAFNEWYQANKIDICPKKTTEERLEDLINQVDSMDAIIAELLMEV